MQQPHTIVVQPAAPAPSHGYGSQILIGALAGVLAWWLIETITSSRAAGDEGAELESD